ncbi:MAG: methyl-accepting chemotaxis protein [Rhizobium sp.]
MARRFKSLSFKVIATFLLLTLASVAVLDGLAYLASSRLSDAQALQAKNSVLIFRGDMLKDQLQQIGTQADSIARIEAIQMAITSLRSGWKTIEKSSGNARAELQKAFVSDNPNPADQREKLLKPVGPSGFYYSSHETAQTEIARDLQGSPFSDLLIADMDGAVIYSYRKGPAFAENLKSADWSGSSLGQVYGKAIANIAKATDDTAPAAFSGLQVDPVTRQGAVYFAVPILKLGAPKGVILFQVRDDILASLLSKGNPSTSSARSVVVSPDGTVIGVDDAGHLVTVDGAAYGFASAAVASDEISVADLQRPDGAARAYARPVAFGDSRFLVVESVLKSELNAGSMAIATLLTLIGLGVLLLVALATGGVMKLLFSPLARLAIVTQDVASGKLDGDIGSQNRSDEIGTMAKALARFRQSLTDQQRLEAASAEAEKSVEAERRARLAEREGEARALQDVVKSLDDGLHHLATGDLAYRIETTFPAELEGLRVNFNKALATLSDTMTAIGGNSMAVHSGSEEMRTGATDLAGRTERQAASITETASAIGAITDAVRVQISRAEQAARIARDAQAETQGSGRIMRETIAAMEAIQSSSRDINQIVSVIDSIAFQTNLLALNAGVEAARAGDSGKGFAVVAQEVRQLAQRSSSAAKEIAGLLKKSTEEVESGVSLVERASVALGGISDHVENINVELREIMRSTHEEADTLRQINLAVTDLDAMTQQNAAMVEETTAAIHRLASEAGEMDNRLGNFKLFDPAQRKTAEIHILHRRR